MGTVLVRDNNLGLYVKEFFGGKDRGICYSIKIDIELEQHQFCAMSDILHHIREEIIKPKTTLEEKC